MLGEPANSLRALGLPASLKVARSAILARAPIEKGEKTLLLLSENEFNPESDAGSRRLAAIAEFFREHNWHVDLRAPSSTQRPGSLWRTASEPPPRRGPAWREATSGHRVIYAAYPSTAARYLPPLRLANKGHVLVYDMVDAHGLRMARRSVVLGDRAGVDDAERIARVERFCASIADITVAVTPDELEWVRPRTDGGLVVPTVHRASNRSMCKPDGAVLMLGNYRHDSNEDGARWFLERVCPQLPSLIRERVMVAGAGLPPDLIHRCEELGVRYLGWVDDLETLYRNTALAVAPLRYAAGVRGKITEALCHGVPVLATEEGMVGMPLSTRDGVVIAGADDFGNQLVSLLSRPTYLQELGRDGLENVGVAFGVDSIGPLVRLIESRVELRAEC